MVCINSTKPLGNKLRLLKQITNKNNIANQGMFTLPLPPSLFVLLVLAAIQLNTSTTGTSIITRIIFTMIALLATSAPMALPAPTT